MKKLLIGLLLCSLFQAAHGSVKDTYREPLYDLISKGEFLVAMLRYNRIDLIKSRDVVFRAPERILPGISKLDYTPYSYSYNQSRSNNQSRELDFLLELEEMSRMSHVLRPFVKKAYANCCKYYKKKEIDTKLYGSRSKFPKKMVIDSYPSSYKQGSVEDIVFGPLLNPKSMTKEEYKKQVEAYYQRLGNTLKFFLKNRSEILFPGVFASIAAVNHCEEVKKLIKPLLPDDYAADKDKIFEGRTFLKPDEKRDLAVLKAYWKASIEDELLVPFVEKGHANFKKCYGHSAPVRSLVLNKGLTLGMYADKNKNSEVAKLCHKLEPAPKSFLFKAAIFGIVGGVSYLAYKKYKSFKSSEASGTMIDLSSVKA